MVEEKREKTNNNNKQTLSEKKETAGNISEQRDNGWIHVIRVHDTTRLAVTTALRGSRRSRTTPHKERMSGLVKHRDNPPTPHPHPHLPPTRTDDDGVAHRVLGHHSYIVNERYNSRNKRASKDKKKERKKKSQRTGH